jgi:hypothetical protein
LKESNNLTHIPLAKLVNNMPDGIELNLSNSANEFLSEQFTGSPELSADSYLHYKDGLPEDVNEWGRTFNMELGLSGDYALATILNIAMKWREKSDSVPVTIDDISYKAAKHKIAWKTNVPDVYQIPVKESDLTFLVSTTPISLDLVDGAINKVEEISLTAPLVSLKTEEDLTEEFSGTTALVHGERMICSQVKVITEFEMDLEGAEVKQAAAIMLVRGCMSPMKQHIIINNPFYVYVKVKDHLVFSAYVQLDSFLTN